MLKISGVGPKLALSVLSGLSIADLAAAVANKDAGAPDQDSRRGQEDRRAAAAGTAGQVRGERRDAVARRRAGRPASSDIVNALLALGYNEKEADWAAKQLPKDVDVSDGIRQALKLLSKA